MDIITLTTTVLRRWYVVVPVLALTLMTVLVISARSEPQYELKGVFLAGNERFASPEQRQDPPENDAAFTVEISSVVSSAIIAEALQSGEVVERLRDKGAKATYDVNVSGNLLRVSATDPDRQQVVRTVVALFEAIEDQVVSRQQSAEVPEDERVGVEVLAVPSDASVQKDDGRDDEDGEIFTAFGSVRLVGPVQQEVMNPYQRWSFSLEVLEALIASDAGKARIAEFARSPERGADGTSAITFSISGSEDEHNGAPLAHLSAMGPDRKAVQRTFHGMLEYTSQELDTRQATLGVPPEDRLELWPLSVPNRPTSLGRDLTRPLLTVIGLGGIAAVGSALALESLQQGLKRRALLKTEEPLDKEAVDDQVHGDDPSHAEAAASEPVEVEPVEAEPNGAEPGGTGPAEPEPAASEPVSVDRDRDADASVISTPPSPPASGTGFGRNAPHAWRESEPVWIHR